MTLYCPSSVGRSSSKSSVAAQTSCANVVMRIRMPAKQSWQERRTEAYWEGVSRRHRRSAPVRLTNKASLLTATIIPSQQTVFNRSCPVRQRG